MSTDNTTLADAISNRRRSEATIIVVPTDPITALVLEVQDLRKDLKELREEVAKERALDRKRISRLEKADPQPAQKDRAEILRALLVVNGGKMLAKDARKVMRLPKNRFSELLKTCDFIETKPYHLDERQDVIILKSKLVPRN